MTDLDRLIHEPARLLIVALLNGVKEADFLYLQKQAGLTKGNLSSHIAKLEEAGYVEVRRPDPDVAPAADELGNRR
jgi:DNA-binding MarR family transcriptional regulator